MGNIIFLMGLFAGTQAFGQTLCQNAIDNLVETVSSQSVEIEWLRAGKLPGDATKEDREQRQLEIQSREAEIQAQTAETKRICL